VAGHSKWANIKRRKEQVDAKKGKIFSRLVREIRSAIKQGGPDLHSNSKLRIALQKAKSANLPNEIIERNMKKGSAIDQLDYEEIMYELYGYGGIGILVEIMTDNKNRAASEIRIAINKKGGSIATPGAVRFNFEERGILHFTSNNSSREAFIMKAIENGAIDIEKEGGDIIVLTPPDKLYEIKEALQGEEICIEANLEMIPKSYIECEEEDRRANEALLERLRSIDDVEAIYHNMK